LKNNITTNKLTWLTLNLLTLTAYMNLKISFITTLLITLSLAPYAPSVAQAEDFKIAMVNMGRVLNESKLALTKRKELETKSGKIKKELEAEKAALNAQGKKLEAQGAKSDSKEVDNLRNKSRDFSRKVKDVENDLRTDYGRSMKELVEKARKVIADHAKKNNLQLVLEKGDGQASPILYGSSAMDITEAILVDMNRG